MRNKIVLMMMVGTMSTIAMADVGYEDQLTFIPKIALGENINDGEDIDFEVNGFAGFNADILYGVTSNLEMGINFGWSQYDIDDTFGVPLKEVGEEIETGIGKTSNYNVEWDKTLDNIPLTGVIRYNFNELDLVTPYISARAGWSFGKASGEISDQYLSVDYDIKAEIEGRWIAGIAGGLEYENLNIELGYQVTQYKLIVEGNVNDKVVSNESEKIDVGLVYVSLGYRFE